MDEVREFAFTPPPPSDRVHKPLISSFALIKREVQIVLLRAEDAMQIRGQGCKGGEGGREGEEDGQT